MLSPVRPQHRTNGGAHFAGVLFNKHHTSNDLHEITDAAECRLHCEASVLRVKGRAESPLPLGSCACTFGCCMLFINVRHTQIAVAACCSNVMLEEPSSTWLFFPEVFDLDLHCFCLFQEEDVICELTRAQKQKHRFRCLHRHTW